MAKRGVAVVVCVSTIWFACGSPSNPSSSEQRQTAAELGAPILLPTGALITPLEAEGATFQALNPGLPNRPDFTAGQATSTALSPDGRLLLVLTTGYNRNYGPDGRLSTSSSLTFRPSRRSSSRSFRFPTRSTESPGAPPETDSW